MSNVVVVLERFCLTQECKTCPAYIKLKDRVDGHFCALNEPLKLKEKLLKEKLKTWRDGVGKWHTKK